MTTTAGPAGGPGPASGPALPERVDVAIIGGGIVGLAIARELLERRPDFRVAVLERETELATHQTGRNSGVLHAGLYYAPGSLKARLTRQGKDALERYADERGDPLPALWQARRRDRPIRAGRASRRCSSAPRRTACPGSRSSGPERIREIEPHAAGIRGLWSPSTGIIDFRAVAGAFADDVRRAGGTIAPSPRVRRSARRPATWSCATTGGRPRGRSGDRLRRAVGRSGRRPERRPPGTDADHPLPGRLLLARRRTRAPSCAASSTPSRTRASRSSASTSPGGSTARCGRARTPCWPSPGPATVGATSTSATLSRPRRSRGLPAAGRPLLADRRGRDVARLVEGGVPRRAPPLRARAGRRPDHVRPVGRPGAGRSTGTAAGRRLPVSRGTAGSSTSATRPRRRRRPRWRSGPRSPSAPCSASACSAGARASGLNPGPCPGARARRRRGHRARRARR